MVSPSKWCKSSMCSRLIGPHSGSDKGQAMSRGGDGVDSVDGVDGVDGWELPSDDFDSAGLRRMHVSFLFTQFPQGSLSSHYRGRR